MKSESGSKDEKLSAENGRIKGDLKERTKEFALNIIALYPNYRKGERPRSSVTSY